MQALVRINAGGRRFEALSTTLLRFPGSHLAAAVAAHLQTVSGPAGDGQGGGRRGRRRPAPAASDREGDADTDAAAMMSQQRRQQRLEEQAGDLAALPPDVALAAADGVPEAVADRVTTVAGDDGAPELFMDVDPDAFAAVLGFLRTGDMRLPTDSEARRAAVVWQLRLWGLLADAFPPAPTPGGLREGDDPSMVAAGSPAAADAGDDGAAGGGPDAGNDDDDVVQLPDMLVVQTCDHMAHDQGAKRHAMTISFGADGFQLKAMCKGIRRDLRGLLSASQWQLYQTHERAAFFVCSKLNNGTADLMFASVAQRLIEHTERMGYTLASSYVTLSPDMKNTSVRLYITHYIFRRTRMPVLEDDDMAAVAPGPVADADGGDWMDGPGPGAYDADGRYSPSSSPAGTAQGRVRAEGYVASGYGHAEGDAEGRDAVYRNFEPPSLGPQRTPPPAAAVPRSQQAPRLWSDE